MATTARFVRGDKTFNLVYPYALVGFVPPAVRPAYEIAEGSSANRTGGGSLVSTKYDDRALSFGVRVLGTSEAQIAASVRRLQFFLGGYRGQTFFEVKHNDLPDPLWGQFGAALRYEIITAETSLGRDYQSAKSRTNGVTVGISLTVKPLVVGLRQRLATASGGVIEDTLGTMDGTSRGMIVAEALTINGGNKMTNPVFGHATFGNEWTAMANLSVSKNTDPEYILPGLSCSAKITSKSAVTNTYSQSIAALSLNKHTLTAYIKLPDSATPGLTVCKINYNGSVLNPTYTALGNGFWMVQIANIAGVAAASVVGLVVYSGYTVYLCAFQFEESVYGTPLCYGDLLGNVWAGTAHASASSRTAAMVALATAPDTITNSAGSILYAFRASQANTRAADFELFSCGIGSLRAYFTAADDKFLLSDGTSFVGSSAQTWAVGAEVVLLFTWGPGGLKIYRDGSATPILNIAAYIPPVLGALAYVANAAGTRQSNDLIRAFTTYDHELTTAEWAGMYASISALTASDSRADYLPWLWTKDGDNQVDNCNDATRDNWAVAAGIPGNGEALTVLDCNLSNYLLTYKTVYISNAAHDVFVNPGKFYLDISGTADANASGGEYLQAALLPTMSYGHIFYLTEDMLKMALGREFISLFRFADDGTTSRTITPYFSVGGSSVSGQTSSFSATATFSLVKSFSMRFSESQDLRFNSGILSNPLSTMGGYFTRTGASAGNVRFDYLICLFRPIIRIDGTDLSKDGFIVDERGAVDYIVSSRQVGANNLQMTGDKIELEPNRFNHLVSLIGNETTNPAVTHTMTYRAVYVTPRWELI